MMRIYTYFRSSASYRLRIALSLKGLAPEETFIHLRRREQLSPEYRRINPLGLVPALEDNGQTFIQSLAIIEYLEETNPHPPLLPAEPADRAFVREIALTIACDIHPMNNLRALSYLQNGLAIDGAAKDRWYAHWIAEGLLGLEAILSSDARVGTYCFGETPTLADICLVPQIFNAERMNCPLESYPTLRRLTANARAHPAFCAAEPGKQPDAE
jgi:maleylpyruvate isomerase